jgi:tyrosinase
MALTRRTFLKGATILPFAVWLEEQAWAQAPPVVTRWDARSPQGIVNLKIYAGAVTKMRNTALFAEGNPRSWTFQWYTHQVRGDRTKANEITRIYGAPPSVWKSLALEMWDTCQSHLGQPENYFLPWHRMYVLYFESIIRKVSGQSSFTLPYWNYTVSGPNHGVIPPEFRKPNDATYGSLYVSKRNPGVNNGDAIDKNQPPGTLNLNSLRQCRYGFTSNASLGFNESLDFGLHGNVHVLTGNSQNMGSVPWAAYDPIFWLHHSNIDRLWASWNAGPNRKNLTDPAFLAKKFVFADADGIRTERAIGTVLNIATLGYKYDRLEPIPASPPCPSPTAAAVATRKLVATKVPALTLGPGPVRATLEAAPGPAASVPLGTRIEKLDPNHRLYLVVNDLKSDGVPGVIYHLYLELPAQAGAVPVQAGAAATEYWVGSINFFAAAHYHAGGQPKSFSFDITDIAKKLKAKGKLAVKAELTIAPAGTPAADAKPVVGEVSLFEG